jgi:hypothetical protein
MTDRIPNRLYLDVTTSCNQRCLHCSIEAGTEKPDRLSIDELCDLLNQAEAMGIRKTVFLRRRAPVSQRNFPGIRPREGSRDGRDHPEQREPHR